MSYGIPSVCSEQVVKNFDAIKNSKIQYYKTEKELINIIFKFKEKKIYSSIVSKRSIKLIKEFKWNKILKILNKLIN